MTTETTTEPVLGGSPPRTGRAPGLAWKLHWVADHHGHTIDVWQHADGWWRIRVDGQNVQHADGSSAWGTKETAQDVAAAAVRRLPPRTGSERA